MQVSVIIVNYNVKYFLEQCLYSLQNSTVRDVEVIVVDNQSTDGSIGYLQPKFPDVKFVRSDINIGFAKGCNKGLSYAKGRYILFLNPDTLVAEDTLARCLSFFEQNKDAGAIGVRMLDGSGRFLKESKRAFPSPLTSLYKLFGFAALFPRSKAFSRYHLGHLDEHKNHKVDVLAGAFMMLPREVLEKVGSFDETYFMYGEDIDLSYRVQKAGYQNYYLAETEIIHFKGESTKRGSLNYVRIFYKAMSIFVHKHYGGTKAGVFNMAIHFAIWVRAFIAAMAKLVRWIGLPLIDAFMIMFSFWLVKVAWVNTVKEGYVYPASLLWIAFPAFTIIYLLVGFYAGLYNRTFRKKDLVRSSLIATLILLALYSLLPEHYRFSRAIVLFGSLLSFVCIFIFRLLLLKGKLLHHPPNKISKPYILVIGSKEEHKEVQHILKQQMLDTKIIEGLSFDKTASQETMLRKIKAIALASGAKKVVMCAGQLSVNTIIYLIQHISVSTWFFMSGSNSIIGSDLSYRSGEVLSSGEGFNLAQPHNLRLKRLLDIIVALVFLASLPLHFILLKAPIHFIANCFDVFLGRKTWIGYQTDGKGLPRLRKSVVSETGILMDSFKDNPHLLDYWYARNYEPVHDLRLIIRNYKLLGSRETDN